MVYSAHLSGSAINSFKTDSFTVKKNTMKFNFWMLLPVIAFSCSDGGGGGIENTYMFKEQHLAGKIANQSWSYNDGYAVKKNGVLWITLVLDHGDVNGCDISAPLGNRVWCSLPDDIGMYELKYNTDNLPRNVVFVDDAKKEERSAQRGAIEILKMTETEVIGRMDAEFDGRNMINGNFTVPLCEN
jgi:hypothetical protein